MPLTPEDVANKQFTSTRLKQGYDETEVDDFLDLVEAELTRLYRENDDLKAKLSATPRAEAAPAPAAAAPAPAPAPGVSPAEQATGILALAQETANAHVTEARSQADRIVGEARSRADQLNRDADEKHRQSLGTLEREREQLERKINELRAFEREYRARLKSFLQDQLHVLDGGGETQPGGSGGYGSSPHVTGSPGHANADRPGSYTPAPVGQSGNHGGPGDRRGLDSGS
jgi:DivIVA domain-containing protein